MLRNFQQIKTTRTIKHLIVDGDVNNSSSEDELESVDESGGELTRVEEKRLYDKKNFVRNILRGCEEMVQIKKSQTTLWIYMYRCSKLGPRSLWIKQPNCTMEELTRTICDKAIRHRMTKASIDHSPIKSPKLFENPNENTMQCVKDMIDLVVSSHPELYSEITFKLNIPIQDERTVCRTFSEFAENLFKRGVSWPLIISLLSFSGSLAAECTRNGRSILVRRICDWATLFIVMRLKVWILDNGGWDGLYEFFYQPTTTTKSVFQSDKLQQLNEWKLSSISTLSQQPDKMARIALCGFVFVLLLFFTYLRMSGDCKNGGGGGFKSKFSIYRDC